MKKILVLNFFPAKNPPATGGEHRYFHFYNELSNHYDVTLISSSHPHKSVRIVEYSKTFREYLVPNDLDIHGRLNKELRGKVGIEYSALVSTLASNYPNKYHEVFLNLYEQSDIIIHDSPFTLGYDLFFGFDEKPRIYNSYNNEADLAKQMWDGVEAKKYTKYFFEVEKEMVLLADLVFAVSEEDRKGFVKSYGVNIDKIKLAPNGIVPEEWTNIPTKHHRQKPTAFFIGSKHPPNYEAVNFIINNLAVKCKNINFVIAGDCCNQFKNVSRSNVELLGRIGNSQKKELLSNSDFAINPMFSGGGTNLKTVEFLSAGLPLISTEMGVRGLNLTSGEDYLAADKNNFAAILDTAIKDRKRLKTIAMKGKKHIDQNYSWKGIVLKFKKEIDNITKGKKRENILVLNDFKVSTALSGGEVRLKQLYSGLSKYYKIILLCFTNAKVIEKKRITENFLEVSIPKTPEHIQENMKIKKQFHISVSDIVNSYMCTKNNLLMKITKLLYRNSEFIVTAHPYMIPLIQDLQSKPLIYESLNVETKLKSEILKGHPMYKFLINQVKKIELLALKKSNLVITVSTEDKNQFIEMFHMNPKKIATIKNGIKLKDNDYFNDDFSSIKNLFKGAPVIVFIGSNHYPNVKALQYIEQDLALNLKNYYFLIIGSVCNSAGKAPPQNVLHFKTLNEEFKDALLRVADAAINPIITGSGSNMKLAEYFGKKVPVITTNFGARGYEISNGNHAIICSLNEFANKIPSLVNSPNISLNIVNNAYKYAEQELSWESLAEQYKNVLQSLPK
ncbi:MULTISPECIES: glycosyltransferase family 4 protein [Bacillaceae]|uniref:glycosyltransferase family 4 protein n=1 Tax=Bacillaceae TaxID=186817 RepID=UPI001A8C4839|nr:glycosyltransferase family 4 protein [Bacillus sp. NTK034]MBN8201196.1 glycosyltransferase family 4 protein [Bacillus sp. NTK034]